MEHKEINPNDYYKIGTGWVFDVENNRGYIVKREKSLRLNKGKVIGFEHAFDIVKGTAGSYRSELSLTVPAGVIRKAVEMVQLKEQGKLEARKHLGK